MFDTQPPHTKIKPLVLIVRLAFIFAASSITFAHGQTSIEAAKADPLPAKVTNAATQVAATAKNSDTKPLLSSQRAPLTYCDDTPSDVLKPFPAGSTSASANSVKGAVNDTLILKGNACVVRDTVKMQGDTVLYRYNDEQVSATGNAIIRTSSGDEISGPSVSYNLSTETGQAAPADFKIGSTGGHGKAESLNIISSRRAIMQNAFYTTCRADDPDWYIKNQTLLVDQDTDSASGSGSVFVFKGVPMFASPYIQFPLGNQRQSGLLTPTIGYSTDSGADLAIPYYFNLAPNYDATLTPGILTKRGFKLGAQYGYLTNSSAGSFYSDLLFDDKVAKRNTNQWRTNNPGATKLGGGNISNTNRWYWRAQHQTSGTFADGVWVASVDSQRASDNAYFDDFNAPGVDTSSRILTSEYALKYSRNNWQVTLREKTNQTLQNANDTVAAPYDFEPQLTLTGSERFGNWVASFESESTRFKHPDPTNYAQGWRHFAYPSLRYEYRTQAGFITPKIGVHATQYNLSSLPNSAANTYSKDANRLLPIASLDAGLVFERNSSWLGRASTQTFEPRAYYLYTPYKNQSNIWNFDSAAGDFDLNRIYGENDFTGRDRVSNANQVTIGATSRWIAQDTGEELFQLTAAQRYYITPQKVTLPGGITDESSRKSDILASASGQITRQFWVSAFGQYNIDNKELLKTDLSLRWQPAPKKVLNIGYLNNSVLIPETKSIYASGQWPLKLISKRLYGVARFNYDIKNKQIADAFVGLEYVKDCWVVRLVAERTITSDSNAKNGVYLQLELKGLGALGTDPKDVISSGVAGYEAMKFEDADEIEDEVKAVAESKPLSQ
jgi:LPS-assembly protein